MPTTPDPTATALAAAKSLLQAQIVANCVKGDSQNCFAECQVAADCPSGMTCDSSCGMCGCGTTCPGCGDGSTHIGSWHIANIARALVKLSVVGGAAVSTADRAALMCAAEVVSTKWAAFSNVSDTPFTTRAEWIANGTYVNLFFDDMGWWALALFDLYDALASGAAGITCSNPMTKDVALVGALKITAIIGSAYSSLCGGSVEWSCPGSWTIQSAQKNTVTNMLTIIALLRALPFLDNPPVGAPAATAADYIAQVQSMWLWYSTHQIANPTLTYGDNQSASYSGSVGLFNVQPDGRVVLCDAMSTSSDAYSACTPCTARMQTTGGECDNIPCNTLNVNQWTYNYGVVIAALMQLDRVSSKLDTSQMGPHTDFLKLAVGVAETSVASTCLAVPIYLPSSGLDATQLAFFAGGVVQENCSVWAGKLCNADQFIFRGIYLDWLAELVGYCRTKGWYGPQTDAYAALVASTATALSANSTLVSAGQAVVYPFQWNDSQFDWCQPCDGCTPPVTAATCAAFYQANGHNRFEISNQAAALKALTAVLQLGAASPCPPCPGPSGGGGQASDRTALIAVGSIAGALGVVAIVLLVVYYSRHR